MRTKTTRQRKATAPRRRLCDNCASMALLLSGTGYLHRYCNNMHLYIDDLNHNAVCTMHTFQKGGLA